MWPTYREVKNLPKDKEEVIPSSMNHYEQQNRPNIATNEEPLFGSCNISSFDAHKPHSQIWFGLESLNVPSDSLGLKLVQDDPKTSEKWRRNREAAKECRQWKKHYVEQIEEKVKRLEKENEDLKRMVGIY